MGEVVFLSLWRENSTFVMKNGFIGMSLRQMMGNATKR